MKQDISKIDPNFLSGSVMADDFVWYDILNAPIEIRGLAVHEGDCFCRLDEKVLPLMNEGVQSLAYHTAGGRVRFRTNAEKIAVRVCSRYANMMSHMPLTGSAGIDVYENGKFTASVRPASDTDGWYEGLVPNAFFTGDDVDIEINLPLYNGLTHMVIGLPEGASLEAPRPYTVDVPVVYYGSSITQGGCASRPGNTYQGFLSRWFDTDHINFGFSGSARGEKEMAEYIATFPMSVFVMDYDHNSPSPEHLWNTHENFFKIIRKAHPDVPVIFITRPDAQTNYEYQSLGDHYAERCREPIFTTYQNALKAGDQKVFFVDGNTLFGDDDFDACTVDRCHPNDLGFYRMAQAIRPVLAQALQSIQ